MRAVFLDTKTLGDDLSLDLLKELPLDWTFHSTTKKEDILPRVGDAKIVLTNKVPITFDLLEKTEIQFICEVATGYDNIDIEAAKKKGVIVSNVPDYATQSVAQHTLLLILAMAGKLLPYAECIQKRKWQKSLTFNILDYPISELGGKILGIIGYGKIGQCVAKYARALGMEVIFLTRKKGDQGVSLVDLLKHADVVTIHAPLNASSLNLISYREMTWMKPSAYLINVARGGIVNENDLSLALKKRIIAGAALDVLSSEPPQDDHPLLQDDIPNLILTPHVAWGSKEARVRLLHVVKENIVSFLKGHPQNTLF